MAEESPLRDKLVLVVDDEKDILDAVEETLDTCMVHILRSSKPFTPMMSRMTMSYV